MSISQQCPTAWVLENTLMKLRVLPSQLFLRLMNYPPFLVLMDSSLLCSTDPQMLISSLVPAQRPFCRVLCGGRGRGKLILQPEPGALWEFYFYWGPEQVPFRNKKGNFTQRSLGGNTCIIDLPRFMFLRRSQT